MQVLGFTFLERSREKPRAQLQEETTGVLNGFNTRRGAAKGLEVCLVWLKLH